VKSTTGSIECIKLLGEKDANVKVATNSGLTPIHCASEAGSIECLKLLIDFSIKMKIMKILRDCESRPVVVVDKQDLIKDLIEAYTKDRETPLCSAAASGNLETVAYLVQLGCSINNRSCALKMAAKGSKKLNKHLKTFKHIKTQTTNHNKHLKTLKFLLRCGAEINIRDRFENSALHIAAEVPISPTIYE